MAKEVNVTATQDQWQWVMYYIASFIMPDKLGEKEFKPAERARIQEYVSALFDALVPHSHYAQQHGNDYQAQFGAKEDWEKSESPEVPWKKLNPAKLYTVALGDKAVSGMLWLFTVLLTPPTRITGHDGKPTISHPYLTTPALASRFIWPLAKALNRTNALKQSAGIVEETVELWPEDKVVAK